MLIYVLKNVSISGGSIVSKRDIKSFNNHNMYWIVAFKIYVFSTLLFKEKLIEVILRFRNLFCYEYFLKYFEYCPRVSSLHPNSLDDEAGNLYKCKSDYKYFEKCAEACAHKSLGPALI